MELIKAFLTNFWILTNDMAIYILIGVLFAGGFLLWRDHAWTDALLSA
ncbi:hypothetical protein MNB_SV-10-136 [hydrothermal vent metagenome]|uniref:Uncharacterized protein n=1 Tax=hydrothermal vent metagenome TaxID=652676 RepID=A0A1W1CTN8_9ZZZZ